MNFCDKVSQSKQLYLQPDRVQNRLWGKSCTYLQLNV